MMRSIPPQRNRLGFTLVELLVVIAIIGVLIALLLPAVQSAREAARRTQCRNQVRQMIIGMHNHESAFSVFPTGGVRPWPSIEDYSENGKPFGVRRQGLSWAFQILPYLEEDAVHNLSTTEQLVETPVGLYFCPSRRAPTQFTDSGNDLSGGEQLFDGTWLMDYAGTVPIAARSQFQGVASPVFLNTLFQDTNSDGIANQCELNSLFRLVGEFDPTPIPNNLRNDPRYRYYGVLVRGTFFREGVASGSPTVRQLNYGRPVGFNRIPDGASKTIVIAEKQINPATYETGSVRGDDRGWSDGWDYDTLRLTSCIPGPDRVTANSGEENAQSLSIGSAHPSGFHAGFADGSVQFINYDVDLENLNRLANREDGEIIDESTF